MVRDGSKATEIRRGLARGALSDSTGAASDIRRSLAIFEALPTRDGERTFYLACSHAALAGLAEISGSSVSSAEGSSEAAAAMTILHEAIEMGYRVADAYQGV